MTTEGERSRSFVLDVFVEGEPVRRGARVTVGEGVLGVDDRRLLLKRVFWVSRRAGLLLVFSRDFTAALKGEGEELEQLAHAIERHPEQGTQRRRVLRPLAREVVVCTAGAAVRGTAPRRDRPGDGGGDPPGDRPGDGDPEVQGLFLAVFTQRALHLLARERHHTLEWPVEEVATEPTGVEDEARILVLRKGGRALRLRYLFPEEIRAARRVAGPRPSTGTGTGVGAGAETSAGDGMSARTEEAAASVEGEAAAVSVEGEEVAASVEGEEAAASAEAGAASGRGGATGPGTATEGAGDEGRGEGQGEGQALEMFARRDVAPPLPARLPEFSVSADAIQEASARAAEGMFADLRGPASLSQDFFEIHFQELGEVALGPLMLRKSAARSAAGLGRAVDVLDAAELWGDTRAAVSSAAERLAEVYAQEAGRLSPSERVRRLERDRLGEEERAQLERRLREPMEKLAPLHRKLEEAQQKLLARLRALEGGPPEGAEREEAVEAAAEEWRALLRRLDRAYGAAWTELLREIAHVWSELLLPRLQRLEAGGRRRPPAWVWTAAAVTAAVLLVALLILAL